MYVRLANAWTDQNGARHQAGDTVEVDNVTLAELEAGGYVTTNEEEKTTATPAAGWPGPGSEPAEDPKAKKTTETTTESGGGDDGIAKPDSDGWPGVG